MEDRLLTSTYRRTLDLDNWLTHFLVARHVCLAKCTFRVLLAFTINNYQFSPVFVSTMHGEYALSHKPRRHYRDCIQKRCRETSPYG